jgi:hypothetical protein
MPPNEAVLLGLGALSVPPRNDVAMSALAWDMISFNRGLQVMDHCEVGSGGSVWVSEYATNLVGYDRESSHQLVISLGIA